MVFIEYTLMVQRTAIEWPRLLLPEILLKQFSYQPTYASCNAPLTVKHVYLDCPHLQDIRQKYFTASSLKDIFESVNNQKIISFIIDAHFYDQL